MTEKEYNKCVGKILAGKPLSDDEAQRFAQVLTTFEGMLDESDEDDYFSTEGWRYRLGWT